MIDTILAALVIAVQFSIAPAMNAYQAAKMQPEGGRMPLTLRDDSATDPSFAKFRERLLAAARAGDVPALISMMPPSVRAFLEPSKPESLLARFGVGKEQPWRALVNALELGAAKVGDAFVAPSLTDMKLDMNRAALVARNVRMRSEPRSDAAILSTLSMEIVALDRTHFFDPELFHRSELPSGPAAWARIVTPDGKIGYVYGRFVWAPDHLLFVFEKVGGEWKMTGVSSGD